MCAEATTGAVVSGSAAEQQAAQVQDEFGRGRVVEDQGGGQGDAGGGRELVAQVDGGQRVEAEVPEGQVGFDGIGVRVAQDHGDLVGDQGQQGVVALLLGSASRSRR